MDDAKFSNVGGKMVSEPIKDATFPDNQRVYQELSKIIAGQFFANQKLSGKINYGKLEINDFSICFSVNIEQHQQSVGIYVKIPKADLVFKKERNILPISDIDQKFAEDEYQSLVYLSQYWHSDDIGISFVEPLGFLKDYNAIITRHTYATDYFKFFRKWDILQKLYLRNRKDPVHTFLSNLGIALYRFHNLSAENVVFSMKKTLNKIEYYCSELKSYGIDNRIYNHIVNRFKSLKNYEEPAQRTNTLKGLDIRNVFIDRLGKIFILDPGRMKKDYREADLARFLVTCRILYWGSLPFFLRISPDHSYEESFLQGYWGKNNKNNNLLTIFIIKELVKHWYTAHIVLQNKTWPLLLKQILKYAYINPFYQKQLTREITKLEGLE